MSFYHHDTIRRYTGSLLSTFNDLEVRYKTSSDVLLHKNVPLKYSNREKAVIVEKIDENQSLSGNYNVLPKASLVFNGLSKSLERQSNKLNKVNVRKNKDTIDFLYNGVAYDFSYSIIVMCKGSNEAMMLIEQLLCKFNPTVQLKIFDADNLTSPTNIPVSLDNVNVEQEDYNEYSTNIVTVTFDLTLSGYIYPPIKNIQRIKEFKTYINTQIDDTAKRATIMGYDVENGELTNENIVHSSTNVPVINDITVSNNLMVVNYEDLDSKFSELDFTWEILSGDAVLYPNLDKCTFEKGNDTSIEVQVTIKDASNNYVSASKMFNV